MATRREKVILELEDNFSSDMARAAAATALLDKNLKALDGSAVRSQRSVSALGKNDGLPALSRHSGVADRSINQLTGRLALFVKTAALIGPAVSPIGAAAVPALSGMATQLGLTVAAAGTAVLAFQGIGDGLEALNAYQLEPTAENFQKMQLALEKVGPAGADFVRFLDSVAPQFEKLQMTAREGLFPGVQDGITSLLDLLPQMDRIVGNVAEAMGQLASEAGAGLSGEGFTAFFNYLESSAKPILVEMGRTIGNFAQGLGNMLVGFGPLSADFSGGLLDMSRSFNEWTQNLDDNQAFQEFLSYVQESAPKVLDLLGSFVNVFVQVAQAMAPVGDVIVPALTQLLDVVAKIADSPLGTVFFGAVAGMSAYSLAAKAATAATARLGISGATSLEKFNSVAARGGQIAAGIGMVGLAMTDLDDKAGLSNTAMLTLAGTMAGPWGAAAGAAVGFTMDLASGNNDLATAIERANRAAEGSSLAEQQAALRGLREEQERLTAAGDSSNFWTLDVGKNLDFFKAKYAEATGATEDFQVAQRGLQQSMSGGAGLGELLVGPLGLTAEAAEVATSSIEDFSAAVLEAMGILDGRASLRDARDAMREFNRVIDEGPAKLRKGTAAWDSAEAALDNIAKSSLNAAEEMKKLGKDPSGFLDRQRTAFLAAADDMKIPTKAAERLADKLGLLDKTKATPEVDVDTKGADGKIDKTRRKGQDFGNSKWEALLGIDNGKANSGIDESNRKGKDYDGTNWEAILGVDISGVSSGVARAQAMINGITGKTVQVITQIIEQRLPVARADGGIVTGPGGPREDRIPAWLSNGEFVVNAAATQRNIGLLQQINAQKFADGGLAVPANAPRFAVGGTVRGADGPGTGGRPDHGIGVAISNINQLGHGVGSLERQLRRATRELERETDQRKTLIGNMKAFKSEVSGSFDGELFGNGAAGLQLQLEADRNDSRSQLAALQAAKRKGLSGGLFNELAASGDLTTAQQIAGMSRGQIGQLEKLFAQTNQAQAALGGFAAETRFGKSVDKQNRVVERLDKTVDGLTKELKALKKSVKDGAREGTSDGMKDRDRRTNQRVKAGN